MLCFALTTDSASVPAQNTLSCLQRVNSCSKDLCIAVICKSTNILTRPAHLEPPIPSQTDEPQLITRQPKPAQHDYKRTSAIKFPCLTRSRSSSFRPRRNTRWWTSRNHEHTLPIQHPRRQHLHQPRLRAQRPPPPLHHPNGQRPNPRLDSVSSLGRHQLSTSHRSHAHRPHPWQRERSRQRPHPSRSRRHSISFFPSYDANVHRSTLRHRCGYLHGILRTRQNEVSVHETERSYKLHKLSKSIPPYIERSSSVDYVVDHEV